MAEDKSVQDQLRDLHRCCKGLQHQIEQMQRVGGFTDAKTLSMRAARIEDRTEALERKCEMLTDVAAHQVTMMDDHLKDRHDADLDRDNAIDVISFRRIRRRMQVWAESSGLMGKRNDLREARQNENRLRPAIS